LFKGITHRTRGWLGVALSLTLIITTIVAGAAVASRTHPDNGGTGAVICRPDGRRTVESHGVYYIVRNDVFVHERQCIKLERGAGFVVIETHANSHVSDNDAFPEILYGCEWGVCSKNTVLPKRVYRLRHLVTSWGASWHRADGHFNVAYDIWFGHLHTIHGHPLGAELMIWLGTKRFGTPTANPIYVIDGVGWYYASHIACNIYYGCWNYILFRRVVPTTHASHLSLLPFIHQAERLHQLSWRWFLKQIDVGFEIWRKGLGLAVHSFSVQISLWPIPHKSQPIPHKRQPIPHKKRPIPHKRQPIPHK
jgi:hypothetical protein